ncbi:unnamed protein product [Trichogramma brassicae]|uniref:Deoxyhypusine monooxygenase n=1 Tax=Trichogramma brassicae TaxID=86971 RepID=A0A6H5IIS7_9HYME|nr:unnamed protein product [Trichogramma brassicae]
MVVTISNEQIVAMGNILNDKTKPLNERFRALFTLKNIKEAKSVEQIIKCFDDPSSLLKHELAYVLGQMQLDEAIPKLIEVLKDTKQEAMVRHEAGLKASSALFRHEIAFVLGQLKEEITAPALEENLADPNENEMVRHECAEALGAIASPYCWEVLKKYVKDEARVVRESCLVALDICEHENNGEFQYANGLSQIISS